MADFDAGFEKYIIFHRGVAKVGINANGEWYAEYQDGTIDVFGDPLGDTNRQLITETANAAQGIATTQTEVQEKLTTAQNLVNSISSIDGIESITNNGVTTFHVAFDDIEGVTYENNKYKVVTKDEINSIINNVEGISLGEDGKYYVESNGAVQETKTILNSIPGLDYNSDTDKYFIAFDDVDGIIKEDDSYKVDLNNMSSVISTAALSSLSQVDGIKATTSGSSTTYSVDFSGYMEEATAEDITALFS